MRRGDVLFPNDFGKDLLQMPEDTNFQKIVPIWYLQVVPVTLLTLTGVAERKKIVGAEGV